MAHRIWDYRAIRNKPDYADQIKEANSVSVKVIDRVFKWQPLVDKLDTITVPRTYGKLVLVDASLVVLAEICLRDGLIQDYDLTMVSDDEGGYKPVRPFILIWKPHFRNDHIRWRKLQKTATEQTQSEENKA